MRVGLLEADRSRELARCPGGSGAGNGHLAHSLERHERTVQAVQAALEEDGHTTLRIPVDERFHSRLAAAAVDIVFNTYFGPARRQDQAYVASLMEFAGIPFTGSDARAHFIGLSKPHAKRIFMGAALPTPRFFVVDRASDTLRFVERAGMRLPMIVKASAEGEGISIDERAVAHTSEELVQAVERTIATYAQPALVEEFMSGREFTIGVLDGAPPRVLPITEILLKGEPTFSYDAKTSEAVQEACPAALSAEDAAEMGRLAVRAGRAIGCRDFWRVDLRADVQRTTRILEINTLPGLQPGYSEMTRMAGPAGMSYAELVRAILDSAMQRMKDPSGRAREADGTAGENAS
jgi:D-alanine-D-alanine ligase